MSYVGDFTLSADIGDQSTFELVDKAVAAMNSYMDFDSYEDNHAVWRDINDTWRAHEEDLLVLSKQFPQILFVLECQGEIASDLWRQFFQGGKMQFCPAYSTFWPYISDRMKEPSAGLAKSSEESEEDLELSSDQIARLDVMDNAVYLCLLDKLRRERKIGYYQMHSRCWIRFSQAHIDQYLRALENTPCRAFSDVSTSTRSESSKKSTINRL